MASHWRLILAMHTLASAVTASLVVRFWPELALTVVSDLSSSGSKIGLFVVVWLSLGFHVGGLAVTGNALYASFRGNEPALGGKWTLAWLIGMLGLYLRVVPFDGPWFSAIESTLVLAILVTARRLLPAPTKR